MMYLAGRAAREKQLAQDWRVFTSVCWRCRETRGEHALWCAENDY